MGAIKDIAPLPASLLPGIFSGISRVSRPSARNLTPKEFAGHLSEQLGRSICERTAWPCAGRGRRCLRMGAVRYTVAQMSTTPTSIRLSPAEKKRIAAAARKRGLSPTAYIKRAALEGASAPAEDRLARLEALAATLREAVEDEIDAREAEAAWAKHVETGSRLYTSAEVRRELGL